MKHVYDRIGRGYTRHRCADPRIVDALAETIGLAPPAVLADIGAGTGNYSRAMADLGFAVKAVEPSVIMQSQACAHASVEWHHGTAEALPLTHMLRAVRGVMNDGAGLLDVGTEMAVLSAMTIVCILIGSWMFSWNE